MKDSIGDRYEILYKSAKENLFKRDPFDDTYDDCDNHMDYRMIYLLLDQLEREIEYNERSINYKIENIDKYLREITSSLYLSDSSRKSLEKDLNDNSHIHEQ
ncbi:MAG: hypothetical protein HQL69_19320 [Magnetococcales bacterium]|nr:hypothetical protein [Magnetococcales bacterium]